MSTTKLRSFIKKLRSLKKGGESNAKMHLVLTPDVFALRLDAAIFDYHIEKIMLKASENRKFRASKKPNVGFFAQGGAPMTQPLCVFKALYLLTFKY